MLAAPVNNCSCLRLLSGRRKLKSPGVATLQGFLELLRAAPNLAKIWLVFSPTPQFHSSPCFASVAPTGSTTAGVNWRERRYPLKIQALGVPITNLARDEMHPAYAGGGMLSTCTGP